MARQRRSAGQMRETVLRLLEAADRPLTALEMADTIGREEGAVSPSLVFLAIRKLLDGGRIHRIETGRAYAPGDGKRAISLLCKSCGALTGLASRDAYARLEEIGSAEGFSVSRIVVEVPGLCGRCAAGQSPEA